MKDEREKQAWPRSLVHPSSFRLHPFLDALRVVWTGKTKDARLRALVDDYLKRLSHFVKCEVAEFGESRAAARSSIDKDSRRISDGLHEGAVNVFLDPQGSDGVQSS